MKYRKKYLLLIEPGARGIMCTRREASGGVRTLRPRRVEELLRALNRLGIRRSPPVGILVAPTFRSFTDARIVAAIANTLGFAYGIPLAYLNGDDTGFNEDMRQLAHRAVRQLVPRYAAPPHIT